MTLLSPSYPPSYVSVSSTHYGTPGGHSYGKRQLRLDSNSGWRPAADSPGEHVIVCERQSVYLLIF